MYCTCSRTLVQLITLIVIPGPGWFGWHITTHVGDSKQNAHGSMVYFILPCHVVSCRAVPCRLQLQLRIDQADKDTIEAQDKLKHVRAQQSRNKKQFAAKQSELDRLAWDDLKTRPRIVRHATRVPAMYV